MKRVLWILIFAFVSFLSFAGVLYKTPSNTIVWEENFSDSLHLDAYNSYIGIWVGGARNNAFTLWAWDGPVVDVVVDKVNSRVYTVGELNVYSYLTTPFSANALFRYDVFANKLNLAGNREWPLSVITRTNTNESSLSWDNGSSRFPSSCVDPSGNLYVVYSDNISSSWRLVIQKVSSSGVLQWGTALQDNYVANTFNYQAKPIFYGGHVFVAYYLSGNVRIAKIDANTGNKVADQVVNTSSGNNYYPDIILGVDNYLYVVWLNNSGGNFNVLAQKINPSDLTRVTWGGNTSDKVVNVYNNYGNANYWYGGEETVSIDVDGYDLYVAFKLYHRDFSRSKVFLQKINFSGGNFIRIWTNDVTNISGQWRTNDVIVGNGTIYGTYNADAYPDVVVVGDYVFVLWINHGPTENDHAFLQKIDKVTGQMLFAKDVNLYSLANVSHHARLSTDGAFLYIVSAYPRRNLVKLDQFGNVVFDIDIDAVEGMRRYNSFANFRTKNLISPDNTTGFVPISARVTAGFLELPNNAIVQFLLSPETNSISGAPTNYITLTNGQSGSLTNQKGNVFMYLILNNKVNEGTNRIFITNIKIEFTDYYFGDSMVGKLPSGSDVSGLNMIRGINDYNNGQLVDDYTYNDGVSSASGFWYFINNGTSTRDIRIRADVGNSDWIVRYFLCTNDGNSWVTNQEITSSITSTSGFLTNLQPYVGGNTNIVVVKVFLTPSSSLSSGDNYTVKGYVDTKLPDGNWVLSDVVGFRGIVSSARPDLRISKNGVSYIGDNIVNSDASDQTLELRMNVGVEKVGYVYVKNSGGNDSIILQGTGGDGWWKVQYFTNGQDVTTQIVNGTFTLSLSYGQEFGPIEIRFSPTNSSIPVNVAKNIVIKGYSSTDPSKEDVVKFVLRPIVSKVELVVRKYDSSSWVGAGVFSQDYSQSISNRIDNGITNIYEVSVTNLGSYYDDIIIKASNRVFASGWNIIYLFNNVDITSSITGQGFTIANLSPSNVGSNLVVMVISPGSYPAGANEVMGIFFDGIPDGDTNSTSKRDSVSIYDKLTSTRVDGIVVSSLYGSIGYNVITSDPSLQYLYSYTLTNNTYTVVLSNPSPSDFEFNIRITNLNNIQWRISVSNGINDITSIITNVNGWNTSVIPSGGTFTLNLFVSSTNENTGLGANVGETNKVFIMIKSPLKDNVVDNLMVYVEKALPPDLFVKRTNETVYRGIGVFSSVPENVDQVVNNSYPNNDTTYKEGLFRIKNLRPLSEDIAITVSEIIKDNQWEYIVYKYIGPDINNPDLSSSSDWSNVTSQITNTGVTNSLASLGEVLYRISGKPIDATNNNDRLVLKFNVYGITTKWEDVGSYKITFGIGIPDIYAYDNIGKDVLDDTYSISVTNLFDKALGDMVAFHVSNRNADIGGNFNLKADNDKGQWDITYYSSFTNDITSSVVGSGYPFYVSPSGVYTFYVKVKAVSGSTYGFGQTTNFDILVENDQGNVDTIRLVSVITDRGIPDVYIGSGWSNVYETVPSAQVRIEYVGKGDYITNYFYVGNWRAQIETNTVYVTPFSVPDFSLKIEKFSNSSWVDITSEITDISVKHIIPMDNPKYLRIIVSVDSNTSLPMNTLQDIDIELLSQGGLKIDKGRFRYVLVDMGRPDIYYVSGSITNGYNVYETTPSVQVQEIEIEKNVTNSVLLYLANLRAKDEEMKIWSSGHAYDKFNINYYISTNNGGSWSNVTSQITNLGFVTTILANSNIVLKIESLLRIDSTNNIDDVLSVDFKLYSWIGISNDNFRLRYVVKDRNRPDVFVTSAGSNVFYPIPQALTNLVEKGITITQDVILFNAKEDRTSDFILSANGGYGDWNVKFILDNIDITSDVVGSGFNLNGLPPLTAKTLKVEMLLQSNSTYTFESNYTVNIKLFSYTKLVRDEFNIVFRVDDRGRPDVMLVSDHDNIYYPSPQVLTNKIEKGEYITNYFYVQNDRSDRSEFITIVGDWNTNTNWVYQVMIRDNTWNDITHYFTNSGYITNLPSGSIVTGMIITYLSNDSNLSSGLYNNIGVRAISEGKLVEDYVVLSVIIVDPRPDLIAIPVSSGGNRVGDNVYEASVSVSSNSTTSGYVMLIQPSLYSVIVENDDVVDDTVVLKAAGDLFVNGKWLVTIRDQNESDITFLVSNVGVTNSIQSNGSITYIVEVKMIDPNNVSIGESNEIYFEVHSTKNTNKVDYVKIITTRIEVQVFGRVSEKVSGSPVKDASIDVYESRTKKIIKSLFSDSDGKFSLKLIPTTYKFVVKKNNYIVYEKEITIPEVLEYSLDDFRLLRFNLKDDVLDIHSFPNPVVVGGTSKIVLNIPERSYIKLFIMNLNGTIIKKFLDDKELEPGKYDFDWDLRADDGSIIKQGVYLLVINDGRNTIIKKIMIK
ncbi:MAG: T9SS type A sorting domain-containing protein [Brevinematia bacterium]